MRFWIPPAEIEISIIPFPPSEETEEKFETFRLYKHNNPDNALYIPSTPCNLIYKPGQCPICDTQFEDLYLKEIEESQLERIE